MGIGRRIRKARAEADLEQGELAEAVGVAENTVWRWEANDKGPRGDVIERVAAVLNKPVGWFYGDETPDVDLATEARLLRQRLEALESASRAATQDAPALPVQELQRRGIDLSAQELQWLREYGGAPCDSLAKMVDLVLLWRGWELRDRLKD